MNLAAVFHRPMSEYAFAVDENTYVFRLRAQRGDVKRCTLHYADRAAMTRELTRMKEEGLLDYDKRTFTLHTETTGAP